MALPCSVHIVIIGCSDNHSLKPGPVRLGDSCVVGIHTILLTPVISASGDCSFSFRVGLIQQDPRNIFPTFSEDRVRAFSQRLEPDFIRSLPIHPNLS